MILGDFASSRIAELHRRRRQLRHAVAAGVNEAYEHLPVYSHLVIHLVTTGFHKQGGVSGHVIAY